VPFELKVHPGEFLARVRGWGKEGFTTTIDGMRAIAEDPRLEPGMPVLLDARELDYLATPPEVSGFAAPNAIPAHCGRHRLPQLFRRGAQFGFARAFAPKA